MSSVVIAGDTSGSVTLSAQAVSGSTTLTLPTTSGTVLTSASSVAASQLPAGSVVQVVSTTKTDTFTHNNGYTFTDVTGASVTITPSSASNKILVFCSGSWGASGATYMMFSRVTRGGTPISEGNARGSSTRAAASISTPSPNYTSGFAIHSLDSPASASAITYQLQVAVQSGSQVLVGGSWDSAAQYNSSTPTVITVMEIKV